MLLAALLASFIPFHPALLLPPALAALSWRKNRPLAEPLLQFGLFLLLCSWRLHPPADDLRHLLPGPATLELQVDVVGDAVVSGDALHLPVRVRAARYTPEWQTATARAQLRLSPPPPEAPLPGTRWQLHARAHPRSLAHTGLRRADWLLLADASDLTPLPAPPLRTPALFFHRARHHLATRLLAATAADPESAQLLQALLLARRADVDEVWTRTFARTGLLHLFAVSGLHLGLLTAILMVASRWTGIGYRHRFLCVLPVLFLFTACTGFRASALRALLMSACLLTAPLFYRRPHPGAALGLALILLLGWAPEQIFDIGFQYSFLMVGGLLFFAKHLESLAFMSVEGDPWAPEEVRWPWWKRKLLRPFLSAVVVSTICFLLSTPLTAHTFNLFSPVALLGNLLAVPLVFLLLATGFPALLFLALPVEFSSRILLPARLFGRLLLDWVQWMEQIPGGVLFVRAPAGWQVLLLYTLPALAIFRPRLRRPALAAALTLLGFMATQSALDSLRPELVLADADRGQALWLRGGARPALMVDAGSEWSGRDVSNALVRGGVNRVEALFLTHPSRAHVEGIAAVMKTHPPRRIFVAAPDQHHPLYRDLTVTPLAAGDRLELAGWTVEVLWPPADFRARAAGMRSLVLRFTDQDAAILVMGGADERVEAELLARDGPLSARNLVAANTPRIPGATPDFLRAVLPEAVFFSGRGFGGISEARDRSEARAAMLGIAVWRVPEGGTLRIHPRQGTAENQKNR